MDRAGPARHLPAVVHTAANLISTVATRLGTGWTWLSVAWLAPFAAGDAAADRARVTALLARSRALLAAYAPVPPRPAPVALPVPDFPPRFSLRAWTLRDAVIYTINEGTRSAYGMNLARKVGSEVMIRAWFKWHQAPALERWLELPIQAHAQGALFGGGITCSALYDTENGISASQLGDMATRGPDGEFVDAWEQPGLRHGSLSSPAYLDYLFRWCREQIDAGADYLFMDEHTAALSEREGYDDHSRRDFRQFLLGEYALTAAGPATIRGGRTCAGSTARTVRSVPTVRWRLSTTVPTWLPASCSRSR